MPKGNLPATAVWNRYCIAIAFCFIAIPIKFEGKPFFNSG
jgi:hypothetical protein